MSQGLTCPKCGCADLRVHKSRSYGEGRRRVRICRNCSQRIATTEKILGKLVTGDPKLKDKPPGN
jgi:transcriptional regulator NrdR family protein